MNSGKTLFAQIMDCLPWKRFQRITARRNGDHYVRYFSVAEQFRVMAFAQLAYRESLRDIEVCLTAQSAKLLSLGLIATGQARHTRGRQRAARLAHLCRVRAVFDR